MIPLQIIFINVIPANLHKNTPIMVYIDNVITFTFAALNLSYEQKTNQRAGA